MILVVADIGFMNSGPTTTGIIGISNEMMVTRTTGRSS